MILHYSSRPFVKMPGESEVSFDADSYLLYSEVAKLFSYIAYPDDFEKRSISYSALSHVLAIATKEFVTYPSYLSKTHESHLNAPSEIKKTLSGLNKVLRARLDASRFIERLWHYTYEKSVGIYTPKKLLWGYLTDYLKEKYHSDRNPDPEVYPDKFNRHTLIPSLRVTHIGWAYNALIEVNKEWEYYLRLNEDIMDFKPDFKYDSLIDISNILPYALIPRAFHALLGTSIRFNHYITESLSQIDRKPPDFIRFSAHAHTTAAKNKGIITWSGCQGSKKEWEEKHEMITTPPPLPGLRPYP